MGIALDALRVKLLRVFSRQDWYFDLQAVYEVKFSGSYQWMAPMGIA